MSSDQLRAMVGRPKAETAELFQIIVMLAAANGQECDEPRQLAYAIGLRGVPIERLRAALPEMLRLNTKFMPSISEIRIACGVDISVEARARIAFEKVGRALGLHGTYQSVLFDDPITNATIKTMGGWVALGEKTESEWNSFTQNEWVKSYKANYEARRGTMSPLLGVSARANAGNGFDDKPPVLIGVDLPKVPGISYEPAEKRISRALGVEPQKLLKDARE